jgi:FkbM family methyltransferase
MSRFVDRVVKPPLKRLRAVPALNAVVTTGARAVLRATGIDSSLAVKHLHRVGTVRSPLPDGRTLVLWSRGDDWIANQVFWRGWTSYEPETTTVFFALARRARVTLDVGAFIGFYAVLAGLANREGRVFAFEPSAASFRRLAKNAAVNRLDNVECVPSAVGAEDGEADFFYTTSAELSTTSSLVPRPHASPGRTRVPVLALDRFLDARGIDAVDLMKIDTETTEPAVLDGMAKTLARSRPHILCEVVAGAGTDTALERRLGPLGYRYYRLTPDGPMESPGITGDSTAPNYLFTTLGAEDVARVASTARGWVAATETSERRTTA